MSKFQRPSDLAFPLVYHTFHAKNRDGDEKVEYRIQDLPEEDFERAIELMSRDYSPEESFQRCRGVIDNLEAFAECRDFWRETLSEKLSIACYKNDGSEELVGVNILGVEVKGYSPNYSFKTAHLRDIFELFYFIEDQHDVYEMHGVDKFLLDFGLVTHRDYRGRGIAVEVLKARIPVMKALGLTVTSTAFTVIGSQRAAQKAGYEETFSLKWSDVQERFPSFDFSIALGEHCKIFDLNVSDA